jgi:hypothetical protein
MGWVIWCSPRHPSVVLIVDICERLSLAVVDAEAFHSFIERTTAAESGERASPVFNEEVKNDVGDENGTNYPQCLHAKYYSPIVCAPCRLDYAFPLVF